MHRSRLKIQKGGNFRSLHSYREGTEKEESSTNPKISRCMGDVINIPSRGVMGSNKDGRIFLARSNPHQFYTFGVDFPTELRLESFSPPYLSTAQSALKPTIIAAPTMITYGSPFTITVGIPQVLTGLVEILVSAPYPTHSFQLGQYLARFSVAGPVQVALGIAYQVSGSCQPGPTLEPLAYNMKFAANQAIPSQSVCVQISS